MAITSNSGTKKVVELPVNTGVSGENTVHQIFSDKEITAQLFEVIKGLQSSRVKHLLKLMLDEIDYISAISVSLFSERQHNNT